MEIHNMTAYPNRRVKSLLRKVARYLEIEPSRVFVQYAPTPGSAYEENPEFWFIGGPYGGIYWWRPREVWIYLREEHEYPMETCRFKHEPNPGGWMIDSWEDALVAVAAHEFYHCRQHSVYDDPRDEIGPIYAEFRIWREWKEGKL